MVRDFRRPEGRDEGDVDANGDGELLVVLDLRPDTDLQVRALRPGHQRTGLSPCASCPLFMRLRQAGAAM